MDIDCVYYVVGGDRRSCYMSLTLAANGCNVFHFDPYEADLLRHSPVTIISGASGVGFRRLIEGECSTPSGAGYKAIVLPVPVTRDGEFVNGRTLLTLNSILECSSEFDMIFGGGIDKYISEKNVEMPHVFDFLVDDIVAERNAVATAEGAVCDAEELSDINIDGSVCLVTGFGRCARTLAKRLAAWGADIIIMARRPKQRKDAALCGYKVMSFEDVPIYTQTLSDVDFCFNTVPARVVCEDILSQLKKEAVVIDIASMPGGVDLEYCKEQDIQYRHSLGIPGKMSPKSSGIILAEAAMRAMSDFKNRR